MNESGSVGVQLGESNGSEVNVPAVVIDLPQSDLFSGQQLRKVDMTILLGDITSTPPILGGINPHRYSAAVNEGRTSVR